MLENDLDFMVRAIAFVFKHSFYLMLLFPFSLKHNVIINCNVDKLFFYLLSPACFALNYTRWVSLCWWWSRSGDGSDVEVTLVCYGDKGIGND